MRVLHIIPTLMKGGAERLTLDICRELILQGVDAELVTFRQTDDYQYLSSTIHKHMLPVYVRPSLTSSWDIHVSPLHNLIAQFKPDIIHSHLFEAEIVSRYQLHKQVAYVTHLHDNMPQMRNWSLATITNKRFLTDLYEKNWLLKQYRKCNNHFIAISKDTEQYFKNVLPIDLQRLTVMPNAINYNNFYNDSLRKVQSTSVVKTVTTGSLVDKKNQIFLVDIVKALNQKNIRVQAEVLGDGPNRKMLEKRIQDEQLQDQIFVRGNVNNVQEYLNNADVYIHTAWYEPFGLVLLEAMAAGLPVVCLDGKGNRDVMLNGQNGYIIEEQNPNLFAERIQGLLQHQEQYTVISNFARTYAAQYDIRPYTQRLIQYYNSIISSTKRA